MLTLPNSENWRFRFRSPTQKCNHGTQQASQGISKMTYDILLGMKKKQVVFWWSIISTFFSPWGNFVHQLHLTPGFSPRNISGSPKLRCCLAATPVKRCPGRFGWRDSAGMDDPFVGWVQWVQSLEHITHIPTLQSTQQRTQHVYNIYDVYIYIYIHTSLIWMSVWNSSFWIFFSWISARLFLQPAPAPLRPHKLLS